MGQRQLQNGILGQTPHCKPRINLIVMADVENQHSQPGVNVNGEAACVSNFQSILPLELWCFPSAVPLLRCSSVPGRLHTHFRFVIRPKAQLFSSGDERPSVKQSENESVGVREENYRRGKGREGGEGARKRK